MLRKLRLNGAEALAQALVESSIEVVFGIPGVHNLALFESLRRSGIRIVSTTHEQGAAFMANGYGRATGKPGVFITVPGPGLTNALTPVAEALVDSTPMLGIVTDVPQSHHTYQMHEIEQTLLSQPIAKSVRDVENASDISSTIQQMLAITTQGEPGPCIMQIPGNLYWDRVDPSDTPDEQKQSSVASNEIDAATSLLKSAKRIGLFVGLGAADAAEEVRQLAEWMNAPVATTGSGRGVMDEAHPLSLGFAWKAGSIDSVNRIFATCDLVLAIGVKFSQNGTQDFRLQIPCPLIHVDASAEVLGRNYKTQMSIQMDARDFLQALLERKSNFGQRRDEEMLEMIRVEKENCVLRLGNDTSTEFMIGNQATYPGVLFEKLRELLPSNAIVVTDTGYNERLTIQHWLVHAPRTFINPSNFECMGFAIPTAIGAAFSFPERKVVAIVGDGGLVMSGLEMMTAVREQINLTVIVLNNNGFGMIRKIQQDFFGESVAVDVGSPNFKALAESIGMSYLSMDTGISALEQAISAQTPTLLEIKMQHKEENKISRLGRALKNDIKQGLQKLIS